MNDLHPMALFRLSVLGPLVSRDRLERGETQTPHPGTGQS